MSWSNTTKAKSDQLNADDLIGGDVTIKITNVKVDEKSDQSGIIYYEGDNGKPYKPCKSMRRVIELKWGSDEKKFIGRSMTLTRDSTVKWAGEEVGGIRITHMSNMNDDNRFMLTYSKGNKRPYKVENLIVKDEKAEKAAEWASKAQTSILSFENIDDLITWRNENAKMLEALKKYSALIGGLNKAMESQENKLTKEN